MAMGLSEEFTKEMLKIIHNESIQIQTKVMNKESERV
jgi:chorismate mutase